MCVAQLVASSSPDARRILEWIRCGAMHLMGSATVVQGSLKYRDGKKWKSRFGVVRKHSPVAGRDAPSRVLKVSPHSMWSCGANRSLRQLGFNVDMKGYLWTGNGHGINFKGTNEIQRWEKDCLNLQLYRDSKDKLKQGQTKANLSLENLLAIESGFTLDKESHTLAIICQDITVILAFESRESLIQWQVKIRTNLGEDQQFQVQIAHVPPKSKITPGPARIHVQDWFFCVVAGLPPRLLNTWQFQDLRKYGVVDGKFCFEGGSRCGKGEGLHVLTSNQSQELSTTFDAASRGKLQSKKKIGKTCNKLITSGLDGNSLKKSCSNQTKDSLAPSAESTRPLLLNSSESSICDACCEIARCGAGAVDSWMSTESRFDAISVAASDAETVNALKVWVPEAGAYLVDRVALLERCPKWTEGDDKNKMADALSLSSHDSNNSSSSEYSVPRTYIADTYYDRPRNVVGPLLPPRSPAKTKTSTPPAKPRKPENGHRCVWDNPAYAKTPGSTGGTPLGSPKKGELTCNSPTKMRLGVQLNLMSPSRRTSTIPVTPGSTVATPSACPCCQCEKTNPYGDYSVPRTALAHLFLREHQVVGGGNLTLPSSASTSTATTPSVDKNSCSTRTSLMSSDSGDYDTPRRVKDCLATTDTKGFESSLMSGSCLGLTLHACSCGLKAARTPVTRHLTPSCPCVRVANWAEHFVPCKHPEIMDDTCLHRRAVVEAKLTSHNHVKHFVHQHSCLCPETDENNEWVSRPPVDPTTKPQLPIPTGPCTTQPTANPIKGPAPNYANVQPELPPLGRPNAPKPRINYANLEFVDSLPLYENAGLLREAASSDEAKSSRCTSCGHNFVRELPNWPETKNQCREDGNYLLMQPVSGRNTPLLQQSMTLPRDRKSVRNSESEEQLSEYIRMSDLAKDMQSLPLRPFLPLQMSKWKELDLTDFGVFRSRSVSDKGIGKCMNRSLSLEPSSGRSHSVVELQKEVFLRKRSSSADSRGCSSAELEVSLRTSVTLLPRRPLLLSRLTSTATRGSPSNDEDVDVVLRNLDTNSRTDASPTNIKRSSSVPCNPGNRDSASSSDSGVSTGSPKQPPAFPTAPDGSYMEMALPKTGTDKPEDGKLVFRLKRCENDCKNNQGDSAEADPVWIKRDDLKDVSPNHEMVVHPCFVDSKSNSSASDMSDYIETLSLSSHGSSDVPRADDGLRLPSCITTTLRPRSGREYLMLDRALLEECFLHQTVDPNTAQQIPSLNGDVLTTGLRCDKNEAPDVQQQDSNTSKLC